jgi:hypothetical protein
MMTWRTPAGNFLVRWAGTPVASYFHIVRPDGQPLTTCATFYEFDPAGKVVRRYNPAREYSIEDELGIAEVHEVIGDRLMRFEWYERDAVPNGQQKDAVCLTGLEEHVLPFDVRRPIEAYERLNRPWYMEWDLLEFEPTREGRIANLQEDAALLIEWGRGGHSAGKLAAKLMLMLDAADLAFQEATDYASSLHDQDARSDARAWDEMGTALRDVVRSLEAALVVLPGRMARRRLTRRAPTADTGRGAKRALALAGEAHDGQTFGALPYWAHLREVAANVENLGFPGESHAIVACLHDVLEHTRVEPEQLSREFGAEVLQAVEQLTRREGQGIVAYFDGMGELALAVKIADRYTHLLWLGKARPAEFDLHRKLLAKYEEEMPELLRRAEQAGDPSLRRAAERARQELLAGARRVGAFGHRRELDGSLETLPKFFIVGNRPVKAVPTAAGGMDVLAYDWSTCGFKRGGEYLSRIAFPNGEVEQVTEEEFERRVAALEHR